MCPLCLRAWNKENRFYFSKFFLKTPNATEIWYTGLWPKFGRLRYLMNRQVLAESPAPTTWQRSLKTQQDARRRLRSAKCMPMVHQVSAKCAPRESLDQWGAGWEDAISPHLLQLMVITRNLFHKLGVENLLLPYCNVKVCLPLLYELWEANILLIYWRVYI